MVEVVLASASPARLALLKHAGVDVTAMPANIDERALEAPLADAGSPPPEIAMALAEAKARSVATHRADILVVGADQILAGGARRWSKPATLAEARAQLIALSGQSHELYSAVAVARGGSVSWHHGETARLTMRPLSTDIIDAYLARVGKAALESVGAYQVEGEGIQLFERIEGDYFTILGVPLLPLLAHLRSEGAVPWATEGK